MFSVIIILILIFIREAVKQMAEHDRRSIKAPASQIREAITETKVSVLVITKLSFLCT